MYKRKYHSCTCKGIKVKQISFSLHFVHSLHQCPSQTGPTHRHVSCTLCCFIWRVEGFPQGPMWGWREGQARLAEHPGDLSEPWRVRCPCGHRCGWHWADVEQRVPCSLTSRCALARSRVLPLFCLHGHRCIKRDDLILASCVSFYTVTMAFITTVCMGLIDFKALLR